MPPTDSARRLHVIWAASLFTALATPFLLVRLFPDGARAWKFIVVFALMATSLLVFAFSHVILMHRSWRVRSGSDARHKAKRVLYWLLAPTMVVGFLGFLITLSSMLFR